MSDRTRTAFPRRDAHGRFVDLRELLGMTLAGLVAGAVVLVVFDALFALAGLGTFGNINGWLAVILPTMFLVEDFRAWRGVRRRVLVAFAAAVVGLGLGLLVSGLASPLPNLFSGGLGAAALTITYVVVWFYGIRTMAGRTG
jgi:hypothetical protein